jgi:hypothetical protein
MRCILDFWYGSSVIMGKQDGLDNQIECEACMDASFARTVIVP